MCLKSEQTSIFTVRFTAAVVCYMHMLYASKDVNAVAAYNICHDECTVKLSHDRSLLSLCISYAVYECLRIITCRSVNIALGCVSYPL